MSVTVCLCNFLQYNEVLLSSLLDGCYHYLVFMDPVNGYCMYVCISFAIYHKNVSICIEVC